MLTTATPETVAQTLKHHTQDNHTALEEMLIPQLHSIQSPAAYIALLQAFYGYYKPVEEKIDQFITTSILPDIPHRRKAAFILHDLALLGQHTPPAHAATIPQITSVPQAFGAMYVLEGSALGGRGITRMLLKNKAAGLLPEQIRFFNGYGTQTGPMWTAFVAALNTYPFSETARKQVLETANQTFLYFKHWLQKQLIHE